MITNKKLKIMSKNFMIKRFNDIMNDVKTNGVDSEFIDYVPNLNSSFINFSRCFIPGTIQPEMWNFFKTKTFLVDFDSQKIIFKTCDYEKFIRTSNEDDIIDFFGHSDMLSIDKFIAVVNVMME